MILHTLFYTYKFSIFFIFYGLQLRFVLDPPLSVCFVFDEWWVVIAYYFNCFRPWNTLAKTLCKVLYKSLKDGLNSVSLFDYMKSSDILPNLCIHCYCRSFILLHGGQLKMKVEGRKWEEIIEEKVIWCLFVLKVMHTDCLI